MVTSTELIVDPSGFSPSPFGLNQTNAILRVTCANGHGLYESKIGTEFSCNAAGCGLDYVMSPQSFSNGHPIRPAIFVRADASSRQMLEEWIKFWFGVSAEIGVTWKF